jgi:UDP-N-acetylmuramate--alanine ligase
MLDLSKVKTIHMIGIKGVGMAMLAEYLKARGKTVTGSDVAERFMTDRALERAGIPVRAGFDPGAIPADADLIVYSTAYTKETNAELERAFAGKTPVIPYAEALGAVFGGNYGIAVAGSHGKTTTAAWLAFVLERAGKRPSAMIGAFIPQFGGMGLQGDSSLLVVEADEYQNKLRFLKPKALILTAIDHDHPDYFPTPESYAAVFFEFLAALPKSGVAVVNFDDPAIKRTARVNCRGKVVSYALDDSADFIGFNLKSVGDRQYFSVKLGVGPDDDPSDASELSLGDFAIRLSGRHNVSNALAVIALSLELGVDLSVVRGALEEYTGAARRLEILGEYRGAVLVDDYAHHPTEIRATIAAARERFPGKRLRVVFHPHTYSRTKAFFTGFVTSFRGAYELMVLDIYGSAREQAGGVTSAELVAAIGADPGTAAPAKHIPTIAACAAYLKETAGPGDVILLMGAGDVFRIGEELVGK